MPSMTFASLRIFWMALISVFLMVAMQYLGVNPGKLASPESGTKQDVFTIIKPKLEQKINTFNLKKGVSVIPAAIASGQYWEAEAYVVVDFQSGDVIASKNLSKRLPIASLTKTMTAVVASDLASPEELFEVSERAAAIEPTKMGVVPGHKWSRDELLTALMLTSANDAAGVLAEGIGQKYHDRSIFVQAMNNKANFLGLKNSSFDNPQGFDGKNNFSSVEDLATLTHYALTHYPHITQIVAKDYQFYPANSNHKQADLYNWNGLMGVYPGMKGVKIGNTGDAGYTTIVLSAREGKQVLVVLLGAPGGLKRDLWASELLDVGFEGLGIKSAKITEAQLKEKYSTWKYWN